MSQLNQAKHSVHKANNYLGGARATKKARKNMAYKFLEWCTQNGHYVNSMAKVQLDAVRDYLDALKLRQVSVASLHNHLSCIRISMKGLNADPDAAGITAEKLGLEPRCRAGTKLPLPDAEFALVLERAALLKEDGFVLMLKLQRLLGYRGKESLMSILDLEQHALDADALLAGCIHITRGTKGGRPRRSDVIAAKAQETLHVIRAALVYARAHSGHLLQGAKSGLDAAKNKYHRLAAQVGLTGQYAPHSLRYAYACEKILELHAAGCNRKETLSFISKFLGHGELRNRYVSQVYGKSVVHVLTTEKRKTRIDRAIAVLDGIVDAQANQANRQGSSAY